MPVFTVPSAANPTPRVSAINLEPPRDPVSEIVFGKKMYPNEKPPRFAISSPDRQTDIFYRMTRQANYYYVYAEITKMMRENSLAYTLLQRISQELTRFKIIIVPAFTVKCKACGYESDTHIDICPCCNGNEFITPDPKQKRHLIKKNGKSWIDEANDNGQSLKTVLKGNIQNQIAYNQSYLLCNTAVTYDRDTGTKRISVPKEFYSLDPIKVQQLFDDAGVLGKTYGFTMEDRHTMIDIVAPGSKDVDIMEMNKRNGYEMYGAAYKVGENIGAQGSYTLYTQDEVHQMHWFTPSMTYGMPVWFPIWDDLMAWSALEKHFYKRYDKGVIRKLIFMPGISDEDVQAVTEGITEALKVNDNSSPIVCTPPQMNGVSQLTPTALDLGTDDIHGALATKNEIMNRVCAFVGVPNLFAGDVTQSGGMNNESQQITVFDRYLMGFLDELDGELEWFKSWFDMPHWKIIIDRPTKSETDAKKRIDKMQEAQMMANMGFLVTYKNGEFSYSETPFTQQQMVKQAKMQEEQMEQQMQMQQMQAMMGGGQPGPEDNGILPGDKWGPPEDGTARREDHELDQTKDELDQSQREANGAQM